MSISQIFLNALIRASELGLVAIGLTMTFDILKFANFAHVEFACIGAFIALFLNVSLGLNMLLVIPIAICMVGILAVCIDRVVFKRLRKASSSTLMITSLGVGIALRNGVRAIWGAGIKSYDIGLQNPLTFWGMRITLIQVWIILSAVLSMIAFYLLLHRTKLGKAMRATSDNPSLAQASGIQTENVVKWVWFLGASLAALGGIMLGLDTQLTPRMGFGIIIPVFAATILGGLGNPYGAMLGSFMIGLVENFGLYVDWGRIITLNGLFGKLKGIYVPPSYKLAISFMILIIILLIRPAGILGKGE